MTGIVESAEVQRWLASAGYDQPGREDERDAIVAELSGFLEHAGKTPGEFVQSMLIRTRDGDTKISAKRRVAVQDEIEEYVAGTGLRGHQATVAANHLRSFLIHNGIFMQGRVSMT